MKDILLKTLLFAALLSALALSAAEPKWFDNFEKAKESAKERSLPILALFSGSDWCPACIKLESAVLSQKEFKDYAEGSIVPFLADFPQGRKLPPGIVSQNNMLLGKYEVEGFPTILLLDAKGNVTAQTGYGGESPAEFVELLKNLMKKAPIK